MAGHMHSPCSVVSFIRGWLFLRAAAFSVLPVMKVHIFCLPSTSSLPSVLTPQGSHLTAQASLAKVSLPLPSESQDCRPEPACPFFCLFGKGYLGIHEVMVDCGNWENQLKAPSSYKVLEQLASSKHMKGILTETTLHPTYRSSCP